MNWGVVLILGFLWVALAFVRKQEQPDNDEGTDMPPPLIGSGELYVTAIGYSKGVARTITLGRISNGLYLRDAAADAYNRMMAACPGGPNPTSGYRSNQQQEELYRLYQEGKGNLAAPPGYSNHQMGESVDENNINPGKPLQYNREKDEWLSANCGAFGWKRDGLSFGEPWHMTYVG